MLQFEALAGGNARFDLVEAQMLGREITARDLIEPIGRVIESRVITAPHPRPPRLSPFTGAAGAQLAGFFGGGHRRLLVTTLGD